MNSGVPLFFSLKLTSFQINFGEKRGESRELRGRIELNLKVEWGGFRRGMERVGFYRKEGKVKNCGGGWN